MAKNKNILIAIDNGIIALDVKKQLIDLGYDVEIISLANKDKINKALNRNFNLIILEKSLHSEGLENALGLAKKYNVPTIYLSSDIDTKEYHEMGLRILMMPFGERDLIEVVKMALGED